MPACKKLDRKFGLCSDHPGARCINVDLNDCNPDLIASAKVDRKKPVEVGRV